MINSRIFAHQWTTSESREIFSESARVARWLDVIIRLAQAQAECGIIPAGAANEIAKLSEVDLPIDEIALRTRQTSHSTLGMIQVLRELLSEQSAEYVYFGTTVQDITDNSQILELREVGMLLWRDLWLIENDLLEMSAKHRTTYMAGRTHGQPGSPITFGFKAATWDDEIGRHLQRLREGCGRFIVGQFGGAVGTAGFFADRAADLKTAFCRKLNLAEPGISWLSARDRQAEFGHLLAMCSLSLARIANEVYNLQRREIGELAERAQATTVGSITMPHKRNPESSEQIVALARLASAQAAVLTETMLHEHERDGRSWKAEWAVFPEICHYTLAASGMARELISGLEINAEAMTRNLGGNASSEYLLSLMTTRLGKHNAQALLQDAYRRSKQEQRPIESVLEGELTEQELDGLSKIEIGAAENMIDRVVETARQRRTTETENWL